MNTSFFPHTPNRLHSKITFFVRSVSDEINSIEDHVMSQDRRIQGGCFLLPAHYIEYFCNEFENQLKRVLDLKVMGSDEKMMDLVYLNNPEFCKKIQCDWRQYWKFFKWKLHENHMQIT